MLGIYEDTGALTYGSVTPHDYTAARWLLERSADLGVVAEYLKREMNPAQVETLNQLLHNLRYEWAHGVTVAVATATVPRYLGDVAALASKIMEMENLPVLFMLVRMDDRIQLVGRSRSDAVDAGAVASRMGGGGTPPPRRPPSKRPPCPKPSISSGKRSTKRSSPRRRQAR